MIILAGAAGAQRGDVGREVPQGPGSVPSSCSPDPAEVPAPLWDIWGHSRATLSCPGVPVATGAALFPCELC